MSVQSPPAPTFECKDLPVVLYTVVPAGGKVLQRVYCLIVDDRGVVPEPFCGR